MHNNVTSVVSLCVSCFVLTTKYAVHGAVSHSTVVLTFEHDFVISVFDDKYATKMIACINPCKDRRKTLLSGKRSRLSYKRASMDKITYVKETTEKSIGR